MATTFDRMSGFLNDADEFLPYVSMFTISPNFSFPSTFGEDRFPGLLFCHVVHGSPNATLIAYWSDEPHFRQLSALFEHTLGLSPPDVAGAAVDFRRRRKNIWRRYSVSAVILAIALAIPFTENDFSPLASGALV